MAVLRTWLAERARTLDAPLFPTHTGRPLSRDALERRLAVHAAGAAVGCRSLREKAVTPHVLRHTAAMRLLHAGVDTTGIALWRGHEPVETTQISLHADLALKERALARTTPSDIRPGRYRPPDTLLAFLEALALCRCHWHGHCLGRRGQSGHRHNPDIGIMRVMPRSA